MSNTNTVIVCPVTLGTVAVKFKAGWTIVSFTDFKTEKSLVRVLSDATITQCGGLRKTLEARGDLEIIRVIREGQRIVQTAPIIDTISLDMGDESTDAV